MQPREAPTILNGSVNEIDKYLGPPNITASGRPVDGRSGGGLFNKDGELIGVCSAADPEFDEGLYGALPRVYYELDRNGLSFVYDRSKKSVEQPIAQVATTSRDLKGVATPAPARSPATQATPVHSPVQSSANPAVSTRAAADRSPNTTAVQSTQDDEELVCVLRGEGRSESKVFVIKNPSKTLLDYLSREAAKAE